MIDSLQRIAQSMQPLRFLVLGGGTIFLVAAIISVFAFDAQQQEKYFIPCVVGFLWCLSTYAFVVNFCAVPRKADRSTGFLGRLKRRIQRGWYWAIGIVFIATSVAALIVTYKLISIWIKDFGG